MARGDTRKREDEEEDNKDTPVSDEALELLDEDEEEELGLLGEPEDDKGWE